MIATVDPTSWFLLGYLVGITVAFVICAVITKERP